MVKEEEEKKERMKKLVSQHIKTPILSHIYGTWQHEASRLPLNFNRFNCLPHCYHPHKYILCCFFFLSTFFIRSVRPKACSIADNDSVKHSSNARNVIEFRCIVLNWMQHFFNLLPSVRICCVCVFFFSLSLRPRLRHWWEWLNVHLNWNHLTLHRIEKMFDFVHSDDNNDDDDVNEEANISVEVD